MPTYRVTTKDSESAIQSRLSNMDAGDRLLFLPGDYNQMQLDVRRSDLIITAEQGAFLHGLGMKFHVYGQRNVFRNLVFKSGGTIDVKTSGVRTHIYNCTWMDSNGYAKRIKLGGGKSAHYVNMSSVVSNCYFQNIHGTNNSGRPGGEIISVKSSNNVIKNCFLDSCIGNISLRSGWNNVVASCRIKNVTHPRSGIAVYDYYNKVIDNDLGGYAWLAIGDGDVTHIKTDPEPSNKHYPASHLSLVGNAHGRIRWLHNYKRFDPTRVMFLNNVDCEIIM